MRRGRWLGGVLVVFLGSACATERQSLSDLGVSLRISSIPSGAQVQLDGRDVGVTPMDLSLTSDLPVTLTFALGNFTPRTVTGTRDDLYRKWHGELGVVLLPVGYNPGQMPGITDVDGLTGLATELQRRGDWEHAAQVWEQVLVFSPRNARAHRGMGSCLAKMGRDEEAIREYEQYLFLAPGAPDSERVQRAVDAYRLGLPADASKGH